MDSKLYDNLPSDTPPDTLKKQVEIVQALPYADRLRIACGMSDFSYLQTMNMLKKKLNTTDDKILRIAFVETVYKNDFSQEELDRIKLFFSLKD